MRIDFLERKHDVALLEAFLKEVYVDKKITIKEKKEYKLIVIAFTPRYSVEVVIYSHYILINYNITSVVIHLLPTLFLIFFTPKAHEFEKDVWRKIVAYLDKD